MAKNREMLKEAIAEAKAVKEMAIANAKAALEEAFTPQLKSMISLKLQEMEDDNLKEYSEEHEDPETGKRVTAKNVTETEKDTMEVDLEELLAELEEGEEGEENLQEAKDEEDEDLSDDELKEMIEDVIAQMIKDGELEAGPEFEGEKEEKDEEDEEGEEMEMSGEEEEEDEVGLAELLREIDEMETDKMTEEKEEVEEGLGDFIKNLFKGSEQKWLEQNYPDWESITDEAKIKEIITKFREEMIDGGVQPEYLRSMNSELLRLLGRGSGVRGGGASGLTVAREGQEKELKEAYSTIKTLKSELNEINLLNAKLLYSNKIFKSKNLNENQKVKVLSSFDKAKNVGEVKMVYETLNEGIKVKKETIKENLGRASKSTVTPTTKQPIVESNEAFLRMQKLAGIIK
jgi:hypothetical protein